MKNNKFAKISLIILALALCFGAVFAMTAGAATPEKPKIVSQNIEYGTTYKIQYAVDAAGITGPVTLKVYDVYPEDPKTTEPKLTLVDETAEANTKIGNSTYYIFTTNAISHLNMTDSFYVTAETETNGVSEVKRYSVAEYLYQRLADISGKTDDLSVKQRELYNNTIAYGTNLQELVTEKQETEDELIKNLRYVMVSGGKLDGYFNTGVYPLNSTLPLTADEGSGVALWKATPYTDGVAGTPATSESVTVVDADVIAVKYEEPIEVTYRDGYDNLDSYGSVSGLPAFLTPPTGATWYNSEDGHGKYVRSAFYNTGNDAVVTFSHVGSKLTAETANAFEISLDFRIEYASETAGNCFELQIRDAGGYMFRVTIATDADSPSDTLILGNPSTGTNSTVSVENTDGWINLRAVVYEGDENLYVYINGSKTAAFVNTQNPTHANNGHSVNFANITEGAFKNVRSAPASDSSGRSRIDIDNIFVGFINENAPSN